MLSHEQNAPEATINSSFAPATQAAAANFSPLHDDMLEDAVDQVCAPLIGTLPRAERLARRAALRQELDTLVAAHSELDANPERAVSKALAQFARLHPVPTLHGTQGHVQQSVTQQTTSTRRTASAWPATLLALGLLVPAYIAQVLNSKDTMPYSAIGLYRLELFAAPLVLGLLVGLLARARAARGVFIACAALSAYTVGMPSLVVALYLTGLLHLPEHPWQGWEHLGLNGLIVWPLLGCAGAFAGATIRRKAGTALPRIKRIKRIHADSIQR